MKHHRTLVLRCCERENSCEKEEKDKSRFKGLVHQHAVSILCPLSRVLPGNTLPGNTLPGNTGVVQGLNSYKVNRDPQKTSFNVSMATLSRRTVQS